MCDKPIVAKVLWWATIKANSTNICEFCKTLKFYPFTTTSFVSSANHSSPPHVTKLTFVSGVVPISVSDKPTSQSPIRYLRVCDNSI